MIVTNHTYDVIGAYVPTKEMGGGSGLKYAASTIIHLSKKKEKDGTDIVGNLIKAKTAKSRLSKENQDVTVRLYYDGLLELVVLIDIMVFLNWVQQLDAAAKECGRMLQDVMK